MKSPSSILQFGICAARQNRYFDNIIEGAVACARRHEQVRCVIVESDFATIQRYSDCPRLDGFITQPLNPEDYAFLRMKGTQVVNFSTRFPPEFFPGEIHQVISDDEGIGREAARHFSSMGLQHFAYFGHDDLYFSGLRERGFFGYLQGVGEDSLEHPNAKATYHRWGEGVLIDKRLDKWLESLPKPVGLFCAQDNYARTMVSRSLAKGLSVPDDMAIIGVDHDPMLSELSEVRLTSVIPDAKKVGETAVDVLVRSIREQSKGKPEHHAIPPVGLYYDASAPRYHAGDRSVALALQWLARHFDQNVSVDDMAKAVGMSRRSIEYRFREELQASPYQKLLEMRLQHARVLLQESNQTIMEIAYACGFSNQRELCVRFKQKVGMTPTDYRAQ